MVGAAFLQAYGGVCMIENSWTQCTFCFELDWGAPPLAYWLARVSLTST